ncbi:hypothetical protein P154DRAFT_518273 [Amniculicola lignicola CBS 123094]|uniref:Uncharacterized protein n=1 Tax=Amniculicola lignicola CBS 123094 TaxID=1392246 RepID=A0A6A5X0J3_9PLEO|nr:hypothetical protein P154DRAFT_518273 [Amniculicola lignicola CBS 123094]
MFNRKLLSVFLFLAIMASSLAKAALGTVSQKIAFTIILTTPRSATPTFLHKIQQSDFSPHFIGHDAVFFRKKNPTQWGWSHVFVVEGEKKELPEGVRLRQLWRFGVESEGGYVREDGKEGKLGQKKTDRYSDILHGESQVEGPQDLVDKVKYWFRQKHSRMYVLAFLKFGSEGEKEEGVGEGMTQQGDGGGEGVLAARKKYDEHLINALAKPALGLQIHLRGPITFSAPPERLDLKKDEDTSEPQDLDPADLFVLMSFPSEKEFGEYLAHAEKQKEKEKEAGRENSNKVQETFVLTQEFHLPGKEMEIDRYGWEYGNPYEPYGEDWFG